MERQPWVDHKFNLDINPGWSKNILIRLQDAEIRLQHYCKGLTNEQLSFQPNENWSIKEHIGHLIDLESLHHKRLLEFIERKNHLTGADMSNVKTQEANHNQRPTDELINEFAKVRNDFIQEFILLPERILNHEALHPRLKAPMKPVDLIFFVAEHDDHHFATISEIKGVF